MNLDDSADQATAVQYAEVVAGVRCVQLPPLDVITIAAV